MVVDLQKGDLGVLAARNHEERVAVVEVLGQVVNEDEELDVGGKVRADTKHVGNAHVANESCKKGERQQGGVAARLVSCASPTPRPSSSLLFDKRTPNHPRAHSDLHHVVDAHDTRDVHFLLVEHVPGEKDNAEEVSHRKAKDDLGLDEEVEAFVLLEPHPVGRVNNARELSPHLARVRLDRFHFVDCQGVDEGARKS